MKKEGVLIGLLFLLIFACSNTNQEEQIIEPTKNVVEKKVIIIGIDGCRPDALTAANTPNLDALIANGTYSLDARNTGITISGPGWTSMLTGVWENKHNVVDNTFNSYNYTAYPHLFKRIEDYNSDFKTVSVAQWHPINTKVVKSTADVIVNSEDSTLDTEKKAVNELTSNELTAMFIHFDDVDHAGHSTGFSLNNDNYINAIEKVDQSIGNVISALKNRENYDKEDWLVIVGTDHGGIANNHGGTTDEERTIFIIASGDNIPNKEIAKTTTQTTIPNSENCLNSNSELKFDADGSIEISDNVAHSFGTSQDFSIECRVKSDYAGDVHIVGKKNWDNGVLPGYIFSFKTNTQKFKVNVGDGTNRVDLESTVITDNEWHTVSATFDRDGMLKVYVDGVFFNETSMASIGNLNNNFPFSIGADGNNKYKFKGSVAEVRIFNTLLSDEDISDWKCKVLDNNHPKYDNLQGHWKLDEGTGSIITDSSSKSANGTLTGGNWADISNEVQVNVHNYDHTPRTVDAVITALNHLCIPIQDSWNLEGISLIETNCSKN
ncbi:MULTISPECIES: alkaline phosphatase family protein [Flavobacteriaceae]|uniref:DUF4983 domain-containing protein n=2 Tax=Flavobacteriaceae TaxID=49546 RepID=A0A4Y8AVX4_9FLAO|nr:MULTISPECIES: alkaline phosphatase family protein [Flavobacteriaceae]TEW75532.1 DUF4983 domain-containing protein [Gramella jeungdoensis]GGK45985.1 hypothetical protein GCM10007963_12810 [Lutibacter litoralis]